MDPRASVNKFRCAHIQPARLVYMGHRAPQNDGENAVMAAGLHAVGLDVTRVEVDGAPVRFRLRSLGGCRETPTDEHPPNPLGSPGQKPRAVLCGLSGVQLYDTTAHLCVQVHSRVHICRSYP